MNKATSDLIKNALADLEFSETRIRSSIARLESQLEMYNTDLENCHNKQFDLKQSLKEQ